MSIGLLLIGVCIMSVLATGAIRQYALKRQVLDMPNERSSHEVPIPRGGGGSIVASSFAGMLVLYVLGDVDSAIVGALIGAGTVVASVGFLDDHRPVQARWRLPVHFAAACWAVWGLDGMPPVAFLGDPVNLGLVGDGLAVVALVWLLNLFNFMDGIDGIAGVETVTTCVGSVLLFALGSVDSREWIMPAVLGMATVGFLVWNFPTAKIFMGDVGSGFLGLVLGILALRGASVSPASFWSWAILLGVFIVDATVTLLRRLERHEKLYEAHRSHAYQHAASHAGSHRVVTMAVAAINVFWLLPIALLVGTGAINGLLGTLVAYSPLVFAAIRFNAGSEPIHAATP